MGEIPQFPTDVLIKTIILADEVRAATARARAGAGTMHQTPNTDLQIARRWRQTADITVDPQPCEGCRGLVDGLVAARSWPTLLVDHRAHVVSANMAARTLLEARKDWLIGACGAVRHRDEATTSEMMDRIRALTGLRRTGAARMVQVLHRPDGQQTVLSLKRIETSGAHCGKSSCCVERGVLVTVNDGRWRQADEGLRLLREAFHFTPAEARVAFALLDGLSLQGFSDQAGVQISTVRWHLRNALAKTSCANQRDLVRLLISMFD